MLLAIALMAATSLSQGTDTTISVRADTRLELSSAEGSITVQTWSRNAIRIDADHDEDTRIELDQGGRTLRLRARTRYGPSEVNWRLTVPAEMALDLTSQEGDVRVSGTRGEIAVSTVEGDVDVQGGSGFITLESVEGNIEVVGAGGRLKVTTVDGTIKIRGTTGEVKASAVDGDILLDEIESSQVEVNTVDGEIRFSGSIRPNGRYSLSSHDGNVTLTAPGINADVTVSTFSGDFESDYPVILTGSQNHGRMNFTLGSGGARLNLESFDGTVALRKSGSRKP
jgi:Toastrack DUF4097